MIASAQLIDAIDAVVYADVFGAAVTLETARRFARVPVADVRELEDARLSEVLVEGDEAVALRPRNELLELHSARIDHAEKLTRRAMRVASVVRHVPFVRGIALTGSVAAGSADHDADVDLLVIVADDRIGTVFAILGPASRLLGRRLFCPNLYLAESRLAIDPTTPYVERELAQTRMLVGPENALRDANPWLSVAFPNLVPETTTLRRGGLLQRTLERIVGGLVEARSRRLAERRLTTHYGGPAPAEVVRQLRAGEALRFHRGDLERTVPDRYARRRSEVESELAVTAGRIM